MSSAVWFCLLVCNEELKIYYIRKQVSTDVDCNSLKRQFLAAVFYNMYS